MDTKQEIFQTGIFDFALADCRVLGIRKESPFDA
jgi:hypothetical protein